MECGAKGPARRTNNELDEVNLLCVCVCVPVNMGKIGMWDFPTWQGALIAALRAILDPSANCRFRVVVLALGPLRERVP